MQTFATTAPITAVLTVPAGRVHLVAADRTDTTVEIRPADTSKSRDVKAAEQTTAGYADGVLRIETPTKNPYLGPTGAVEVTIHLPAGSGVQARTEAAELRTTGRLGDVTFDGAYHHITLEETAGLRLTATDGDVEVARLAGPAEITTARGDIRIAEATGGKVVLRTQSGDISITAAAGVSASLDAGTTHGRVSNSLKNDGSPALDIHATTSNGDITARSL
ncbi:DUF4097 family beta strand repeat-containing protein [Nonomuraea roseoviolacea]|uniref:DUF4097 domain-containing protein n=1 Tax=Nonomuraea roseoviolacea subsp. carminata TaxID=160689 RepID=A0ABT1K7L0_9ACTN|nr:DUF4097 family beta strand repeat-containing protein [Nonomuraea roseoviolacea]MCP2349988.1 hypothetical protein [Nonomuraea roseoviolacea subsp. carminata]